MYTYYGNYPASLKMHYHTAIILVEVPPWGTTPRVLESESGPGKKQKTNKEIFDSEEVYYWEK